MSSIDIDEPWPSLKSTTPKEEWIWADTATSPVSCSLKCTWLVVSQCNLCYFMWQAPVDLPSTRIIWEYALFYYRLSGPWPNKSSWKPTSASFIISCTMQSLTVLHNFCWLSTPNCCPLTNSSQAQACSCLLGFLAWQELSWCCLCTGALVPALHVALCPSAPKSSVGAVDFPQSASLSHPVTPCSSLMCSTDYRRPPKAAGLEHSLNYVHNPLAEF